MSMYKAAYRGDPGLFGFLGKVAGGIARAIPGVGNVIGAVGALGGAFKPKRQLVSRAPAINRVAIQQGSVAGAIPPILRGVGRILGRGAKSIPGQVGIGYGVGRGVEALLGGGGRKRYRRMNATNPKALRRAIRRVQKFGEFARAAGYSRPPRMLKGVGFPKKKR